MSPRTPRMCVERRGVGFRRAEDTFLAIKRRDEDTHVEVGRILDALKRGIHPDRWATAAAEHPVVRDAAHTSDRHRSDKLDSATYSVRLTATVDRSDVGA